MVSALFVRSDSIYKNLNIDCYDINRDATSFSQSNAVICHPPCRAWGKLSAFAQPRVGEKELAIYSINLIRRVGGVLEHPSGSQLWNHMKLPLGNQTDSYGGYTISINQSWFGHKAEKKTLLYICGCSRSSLPEIPISFDLVEYVVSSKIRKGAPGFRPEISKSEREATPIKLALWLIEVAELCNRKI